ncbi:hypothetical protein T439DRAFT_356237 [Meredithblackwellia eburnea MCA 4105]
MKVGIGKDLKRSPSLGADSYGNSDRSAELLLVAVWKVKCFWLGATPQQDSAEDVLASAREEVTRLRLLVKMLSEYHNQQTVSQIPPPSTTRFIPASWTPARMPEGFFVPQIPSRPSLPPLRPQASNYAVQDTRRGFQAHDAPHYPARPTHFLNAGPVSQDALASSSASTCSTAMSVSVENEFLSFSETSESPKSRGFRKN